MRCSDLLIKDYNGNLIKWISIKKYSMYMKDSRYYQEKLKDVRWQKKRLQIMERDKWKCAECGCDDKTLNVHHVKYLTGKDPWDYPDDNFVTLCKDCHELRHFDIEITESEGFIKPEELIKKYPVIKKYFLKIGNHKGCWSLEMRPYYSILNALDIIALIRGYTYFDDSIMIDGHETASWISSIIDNYNAGKSESLKAQEN